MQLVDFTLFCQQWKAQLQCHRATDAQCSSRAPIQGCIALHQHLAIKRGGGALLDLKHPTTMGALPQSTHQRCTSIWGHSCAVRYTPLRREVFCRRRLSMHKLAFEHFAIPANTKKRGTQSNAYRPYPPTQAWT